jgi:hypothetical protein
VWIRFENIRYYHKTGTDILWKILQELLNFVHLMLIYRGGLTLSKGRNYSHHHLFRLTSNSIDGSGCFLVDNTARVWNSNHFHLVLRLRMQINGKYWWHRKNKMFSKAITLCLRSSLIRHDIEYWLVTEHWVVTKYPSTLCNIKEVRRRHLHHGKSLKSRNLMFLIS